MAKVAQEMVKKASVNPSGHFLRRGETSLLVSKFLK